jgi:teichuronic acid biosynthesis glycosyltransferase TuaC
MTDVAWIVGSYPWTSQPMTGVFFQTQARALARQGADVTVLCPTPWAPWPLPALQKRWRDHAAAPRDALDEGVRIVRPRYFGVPREPSWAYPDRLIAHAAWRARDAWAGARLIHGHSAVTGLAAWRLARRAGLPFVLTFHGSDLDTWPERRPDRIPDLRRAAREAQAVIAVSDALAVRARELTGVDAIHLPLGSDHRSLAARALPRDVARAELGLVDDRIIVLFVGNLIADKGVRELARAILRRSERCLGVFVGDGPEKDFGNDDGRAAGCLRYPGRVHPDIVPQYMSAADVLVLPSYHEGLGSVLVEAGSLGLPVIASAVGGIPGLLGSDRGVLLDEVSPAAIGSALDEFEQGRAAASAAAGRLQVHVHAEHDVDTNAAKLLEIYRSIGWRPDPR